ncbi:PspC domain-containing protein [Alkalibacterium kapii]|uniref:Phage shock protein PspC N-terminal domain-containing protein n=1 Tax=Alkalibacterium kapii TaxID=426704 RepID=A0A511AVW8_9LACT|nr:PspC domain-containing protein [Alkalibacterium kapii]GEK91782.1 hypothetical protein AKA01nite_14040 [Alkalibacterium kapii]
MEHKLRKSSKDKALHGVCGGIAEFFGISSFGVRLIFIFLPANVIVYIILANTMAESERTLY